MDYHSVYVTAPNRNSALALARKMVESRLAACANVVDGAISIYWWRGKMEEAVEAVIIAKTVSENLAELIARVKEWHEYSCPCVVAWPIVAGNPDYLDWISAETRPNPAP